MSEALAACQDSLRRHSRSFSFAAALFPRSVRDDAAVVYAFCRHADDAVDGVDDRGMASDRLEAVRDALGRALRRDPNQDPMVTAFGDVVHRRGIPPRPLEELLAGMEMDLGERTYRTLEELLLYCYRAAGTVGWMMARVMGVSGCETLSRAIHLGIAMQLTNVCRDVLEDWGRGRLYLPAVLLEDAGAGDLHRRLGRPFPDDAAAAVAATVKRLLALAERYYASGEQGLLALPWRCALAVRTAREVYGAIGLELACSGHDVRAGRVVVPFWRKLCLLTRAVRKSLLELPARLIRSGRGRSEGDVLDGRDVIRL